MTGALTYADYSPFYRSIIVLALMLALAGCGSRGDGGSGDNVGNNSGSGSAAGILSSAPVLSIEGSYDTSGQARDVLKDGDVIYVADGLSGLIVLKESAGYSLSKIGSFKMIDNGRAYSLAKNGDYLYMAAREEGIYVFDVSVPSSPSQVYTVPMPDKASFLLIHQGVLYVSAGNYFVILDISDPANPQITGQVQGTSPNQNLIIDNNLAYIAAYNKGLRIIDISNPSSPVIKNETYTAYSIRGIFKLGDYIYTGGGASGLLVYDVSNPEQPTWVAKISLPDEDGESLYSMVYRENFLFIADGESGVQIVDITTPSIPVLADSTDTPGSSLNLLVDDLTVIVADYDKGVQLLSIFETSDTDGDGVIDGADVFPDDPSEWSDTDEDGTGDNADMDDDNDGFPDINDAFPLDSSEWSDDDGDGVGNNSDVFPTDNSEWADSDVDGIGDNADLYNFPELTSVSSFDSVGQARVTLKDGDIIYVANGTSGLQVLKIAADGSISEIATYHLNNGGSVRSLVKVSNYLFMACRSEGLLVLDVSDPVNPNFVYTYPTPDMATFLTLDGNTLYLSDRNSLQIFDVSTPAESPVWLAELAAPSEFEHVVVSEGIAYIAGYYNGLFMVDVSDPNNPTIMDNTGGTGYGLWAIEKLNNYIFIGGEGSGLHVYDVRDPYNPSLVASLDLPSSADTPTTLDQPPFHMKIKGSYLFVADGDHGIQVVDISDPSSPFIATEYSTPGYTWDFSIDGYTMIRSEEHTSELQSHSFISYAVFCLKKKNKEQRRFFILLITLY